MKRYVKPVLEVVEVIADTMIASACVDGDCGFTGEQRIMCATAEGMMPGANQQGAGYYITCVEWKCQ